MEPAHIKRKKQHQETLRQQLLDAALRIATEQSWEAVTIRRIAEAVAYTTTIVYSHFASKEALLQAISDQGFTRLYAKAQTSLSQETDPARQLISLSMVNWEFALSDPSLYQLMFSLTPPSSEAVSQPMVEVKAIFCKLTGKTGDELDSLVLNWICLRQGCIGTLMGMSSGPNKRLTKERSKDLYIEFMHRFMESIVPPKNR